MLRFPPVRACVAQPKMIFERIRPRRLRGAHVVAAATSDKVTGAANRVSEPCVDVVEAVGEASLVWSVLLPDIYLDESGGKPPHFKKGSARIGWRCLIAAWRGSIWRSQYTQTYAIDGALKCDAMQSQRLRAGIADEVGDGDSAPGLAPSLSPIGIRWGIVWR